ncbi:MAG: glycosyl transferase [Porticoccaceae bacterium]|nr:MAG: glycosyl transferase [Porticoccaceae bacterium]
MTAPLVALSANTSWYLYNFRASTIRRLRAEGYRVACLSPRDDYSARLAALGAAWWDLPMDNQGHNPVRDALLFWRLLGHYRRLRPVAALHFTVKNNVYGTWAARLAGVPAINNVSGLGTAFLRGGWLTAVVRWLYRASQPLACRVFCQNEDDRALLLAERLVPAERLVLVPGSGVDLERFHPRLRRPHGGPLRFLYAGRMLADKGLYELVEAVAGLNAEGPELRCELWLAGFAEPKNRSAVPRDTLAAWATRPGIRWLGPVDAVEEVLAEVDCAVLPSYREGLPRALLEAAAMGLPLVATDVPGCRAVVEDGVNGFLCPARDASALRRALERMLALSEEERRAMGARGRKRVEAQFDERLVVEATLEAVARCRRR